MADITVVRMIGAGDICDVLNVTHDQNGKNQVDMVQINLQNHVHLGQNLRIFGTASQYYISKPNK